MHKVCSKAYTQHKSKTVKSSAVAKKPRDALYYSRNVT